MRSVRHILVVATTLIALAHGSAAFASTWSMPVSGGTPSLGFGVAYAGGTHRGVDIEVAPGAGVVSPAEGTVTFAGRVPADGGGTCEAVTIELAGGHRVSLLPLEGLCVAEGDCVTAGGTLGSLAASGDDSSAASHLHVGLRSGELYLDPAQYLPVGCGAVSDPTPEAPPANVPDPPAAASAGAAPVASAASAASAVAPVSVSAPASAAAVAPAETVQSAAAVDTAMATTAEGPAAAEVSDAGALAPNNAPRTVRAGGHTLSFSTRPVTSIVLALGMLATGIGIVRARRAVPVRVH